MILFPASLTVPPNNENTLWPMAVSVPGLIVGDRRIWINSVVYPSVADQDVARTVTTDGEIQLNTSYQAGLVIDMLFVRSPDAMP